MKPLWHLLFDAATAVAAPLLTALGLTGRCRGEEPTKILILKPDHLGDLILATPALEALRERFPAAELVVLAKESSRAILEHHPAVDRVVTLNAPWACHPFETPFPWSRVLRLAWGLRPERFELSVSLQDDARNHGFAFLAGASRRLGFAPRGGRHLLTDCPAPPLPEEHVLDAQARLLSVLGAHAEGRLPHVVVSDEERARAARRTEDLLGSGVRYAVVHVGAGHPARALGAEQLTEVARRLREDLGLEPVFIGGAREAPLLEAVGRAARGGTFHALRDLDLRLLAAVVAGAALYVGHDTGPTHLACALDRPVVAIFGPSDPRRWGPRGRRCEIVRRVVCDAPCGSRPRCERCRCLEAVDADDVLAASRRVLARQES